jgi:hypothetical protein
MSLYILPENQKLIWDSINKIPQFQNFGLNVQGQREEWFRDIIHQFYENNKFKLLSVQELQQLNRETISYMIQDLKELSVQPAPTSSLFMNNSFGDMGTAIVNGKPSVIKFPTNATERRSSTRDYMAEQKQEELSRQFNERQREYESMTKRGPSHEIDFKINEEEDGPIENMDELIKQHIKQRDAETKIYMDNISQQQQNRPLQKTVNNFEVINLDDISPPQFRPEMAAKPRRVVPTQQDIYQDNSKKNVRWSNTLETSGSGRNQPSMNEMPNQSSMKSSETMDYKFFREFMLEMKDNMKAIRGELDSIKYGNREEPIAEPEVLQNPIVSNILSRLRKPTMNMTSSSYSDELLDITDSIS